MPAARRHVDSQEEPGGGLQVPLQGGRLVREEGLQCPQAPRDRCAQSAGHQAHAELQVQGVCQGELRLEALLLVSRVFLCVGGRRVLLGVRLNSVPTLGLRVRSGACGDS